MNNELKLKILERLNSVKREGMKELISYLTNKTDFFEAPASTRFHSNYKGGLAQHSHNVTELLIHKNNQFNLNLTNDTIYITGYLHDICKCNIYKESIKLRKNISNEWEGYKTFSIEDDLPIGHGEKSVILLQQFIKLTLEEVLMIRWHMGGFSPKEDYPQFSKACEKFKSVCALHSADIESSYMLEYVSEPEVCSVKEYNDFVNSQQSKK